MDFQLSQPSSALNQTDGRDVTKGETPVSPFILRRRDASPNDSSISNLRVEMACLTLFYSSTTDTQPMPLCTLLINQESFY